MVEWVQQADGIWQYIALFLISILPLLDVFYIIPVGIVLEMSPIAVGIIAFLGNFIMVLVFAMFFRQISEWRNKRREKRGNQSLQKEKIEPDIFGKNMVFQCFLCFHPRYLEQIYVALTALLLGSSRIRVITWMGISLVLWSILMTVGSVYGLKYVNWI